MVSELICKRSKDEFGVWWRVRRRMDGPTTRRLVWCQLSWLVTWRLTVCIVDFTIFTVAVTVFLTFVFLNFESENTSCRYR